MVSDTISRRGRRVAGRAITRSAASESRARWFARIALRIAARREEGKTQWLSVTADKGGQVRLRDPFPGAEARWSRETMHREGQDYVFELAAGEKVEGWRKQE